MSTNITENRTWKIHVHGSLLIVRLRRKKSQTKLVFAVFANLPPMLNIELEDLAVYLQKIYLQCQTAMETVGNIGGNVRRSWFTNSEIA